MVGSFVLVWIQFELGQLGIFVNYFVDSLGWLLQGEFVVFGCRYAGMKVPQKESFKVQIILHVRFVTSSEECSSESTVVGLRRFVTSRSHLQGSH